MSGKFGYNGVYQCWPVKVELEKNFENKYSGMGIIPDTPLCKCIYLGYLSRYLLSQKIIPGIFPTLSEGSKSEEERGRGKVREGNELGKTEKEEKSPSRCRRH